MKNRLCSQLNCQPGFICVTTVEDCANLNYYKVACQVQSRATMDLWKPAEGGSGA
uniref:Uncharacterized protein n=1 Tax=Magallana gigas TaxID=29159 RepID=K1Q993_MAGGI